MDILIVGAGFSGAVYARELAEAGHQITVIDRRDHIGGNAFDEDVEGVRVHRYGPHLFHTNNQRVVDWLSQFTDWVPYEHRVKAKLEDGRLVPFPINCETVKAVTGRDTLEPQSPHEDPSNDVSAREFLESQLGEDLTELFFERYTNKMWGHSLREMSSDVVKRVRVRTDSEDRYFPNDSFQAMPALGYTEIFKNIFDHENIQLQLNTSFSKDMIHAYDYTFSSMAIDEYFDFEFGALPYRSIKFHHFVSEDDSSSGVTTINYTDRSPYTRETHWHNIPNHQLAGSKFIRTVEEPCSYEDNDFERYYPVKTADNRYVDRYKKYEDKVSQSSENIKFIGRCGTYQYLDMHQVIMQSLNGVNKWLETV